MLAIDAARRRAGRRGVRRCCWTCATSSSPKRGHIPGATILPRRRIEFRIEALVRDRLTPLVVVDSGEEIAPGVRDPRAVLAAATLLGARLARNRGARRRRRRVAPGGAAGRLGHAGLEQGLRPPRRRPGARADRRRRHAARLAAEGRRIALCDVRSASEHMEDCVPGSVSLPGFEAVSHALDMAAESDVIVLCSSARTRSLLVARTLIDLGLSDVVALDGGELAWRLAGLALETGSRRRRVLASAPVASSPSWARPGWPSTMASGGTRPPSSPSCCTRPAATSRRSTCATWASTGGARAAQRLGGRRPADRPPRAN